MLDVRGIRKDQGKGQPVSITSSDSSSGLISLARHYISKVKCVPLFKHSHLHYCAINSSEIFPK